jgi:hypothetical protein
MADIWKMLEQFGVDPDKFLEHMQGSITQSHTFEELKGILSTYRDHADHENFLLALEAFLNRLERERLDQKIRGQSTPFSD